ARRVARGDVRCDAELRRRTPMAARARTAARVLSCAALRRRQGRVRVSPAGAGASRNVRRQNQTPHRRQFLSAPPVDVIIVNWNNREETVACLDALMPQLPEVDGAIVTVVDNGSTDGSIAA